MDERLKARVRFMAGIGYLGLALATLEEAVLNDEISIDQWEEVKADLLGVIRRLDR